MKTPTVGRTLARQWWTLQRFGLSPGKLPARLRAGAPRVLEVSIPKSGTHLLERALCLHPALYRKLVPTISGANLDRYGGLDRLLATTHPGQVVVSHLRWDPAMVAIAASRGARGLFLVRDPHDMVVSEAFYVSEQARHPHHRVFTERSELKERLRLAIEGDPVHEVVSIGQRLRYFSGWLDSGFLVVRFENLVGPAGGGSADVQARTLRAIFEHLGVGASDGLVRSISDRLFSEHSPTFRRGAAGGWRRHFDQELMDLFDSVVADEIDRYGYGRGGPAGSV